MLWRMIAFLGYRLEARDHALSEPSKLRIRVFNDENPLREKRVETYLVELAVLS